MSYENPYGDPTQGQPDYYQAQPWSVSDPAHLPAGWDPERHFREAGIADAIFRQIERNAQRPAAPTQPPEAHQQSWLTPDQAFTPRYSAPESVSDRDSQLYPSPNAPLLGSMNVQTQGAEPEEDGIPELPSNRMLKIALLGAGGLVALTGLTVAFDSDRGGASDEVTTQQAGVACDVNGIGEKGKLGTIEFTAPVGSGVVQIIARDASGAPTLLNNAKRTEGSQTSYEFNTTGLHNTRLTVRVGTTDCSGEFTLGQPRSGDEDFLPSR